VAGLAILLLVLLAALAAFPWGLIAARASGTISAALGRPVTIGSARRIGWLGFTPEVALADVRIAQPRWIAPGTMATIREARVRFPVLPLLLGRFRPTAITLDGARIALVRNDDGRASWDSGEKRGGGRRPPSIRTLAIRDGTVTLDDRRRHVRLAGTIAADARALTVRASGTLRDRPLVLAVTGAPIAAGRGDRYPLRLVARSPLAAIDARATMDAPLDTAAFSATVTASGRDLTYLDDLVQAGLFPTRAFALTGAVRHESDAWHIRDLRARVGRSTLTACADVTREGERVRLDATVDATGLDFDDFSSEAQRARARAQERAIGDRIVPGTRLELDGLAKLDGTVRLVAHRLLVAPGSPFRALSTTATIDRRRLVLKPLDIALVSGRLSGRLIDDDRGGTPTADIDVTLGQGARIEKLFAKTGAIAGPLDGRIRLVGRGPTLREAIGRANGVVGMAVPRGTARRDYATFAGGDIADSIGAAAAGKDGRVPLGCLVGRFVARKGRMTPAPLVIDTAVSRADGQGSVDLSTERLDLRLIGRPKHPGLLRSTAPTRVFGTLAEPKLDIKPPRAPDDVATGALSRIGYFLKGLKLRVKPSADPPAAAANCSALITRALR
jgi:hypothetical protein